ncbi:LysR family transcriptional regulator [Aureimonas jatrophae]|uniref:DNA-binding transcriptional regulator, LysR family n=1 Tax=Aureimonas jatrophae TaxID=1166073 RepID=A0A1H0DI48_9HYPH|nr:LysR substrate-binding domain-containing protein [Aureimonas jatrophae]MBB3951897.1 DNA-binding transcriptional LysR family regulator [Aureimonas jatrophae]SDN69686.1 DNA-binding transcriptional regulator, LysR family [Aureimonas jatrophae]
MRHMRIWSYVDLAARHGSIRRAAEELNITPSALQRRIQDVEDDLGTAIFERSAQGVRLTAAGETFIRWIRQQTVELERTRSQIESLEGLRRGHIRIACSQALVNYLLPQEIATFRQSYPRVSFAVSVVDHDVALQRLVDYEADMVLIFRPRRSAELQPIVSIGQRLHAVMASDHPLTRHESIRLRDCAPYPIALADRSFGSRRIIDGILSTSSFALSIDFESDSFEMLRNLARSGGVITFQIEVGSEVSWLEPGLVSRPVADADPTHGPLVLGQLRGRTLPVAAAKFLEQVARRLDRTRNLPQGA